MALCSLFARLSFAGKGGTHGRGEKNSPRAPRGDKEETALAKAPTKPTRPPIRRRSAIKNLRNILSSRRTPSRRH